MIASLALQTSLPKVLFGYRQTNVGRSQNPPIGSNSHESQSRCFTYYFIGVQSSGPTEFYFLLHRNDSYRTYVFFPVNLKLSLSRRSVNVQAGAVGPRHAEGSE